MKMMGITRKVDELGRIVLPKEYRAKLGVDNNTEMKITLEDDTIVMRPNHVACVFCDAEGNDLLKIGDVYVCKDCHELVKDRISYKET